MRLQDWAVGDLALASTCQPKRIDSVQPARVQRRRAGGRKPAVDVARRSHARLVAVSHDDIGRWQIVVKTACFKTSDLEK